MSKGLKTLLKSLGFFSIGFIVLYLVYNSQNQAYLTELIVKGESIEGKNLFDKIIHDFAGVNYWIIGSVLFCFMISNISRATRWQLLLEPIAHKPTLTNAFGSIMIAYLVNLGIPRSGEFVRAGILSRYENILVEKAMGTIVTDRILDVLSLLIMIILAFIFSFKNMYNFFSENHAFNERWATISESVYLLLGIGLMVIMGLLALLYYRNQILASRIGQKITKILRGFQDGLQSVFKVRKPGIFIFHSMNIWLMYFLMTYLSFYAFEPTAHLDISAGLVTFVFGTLGFVFPSPGGMGSYHYLVSEALGLYGISIGDASSFANIVFLSITIFGSIIFGVVSWLYLPIYNGKKGKSSS